MRAWCNKAKLPPRLHSEEHVLGGSVETCACKWRKAEIVTTIAINKGLSTQESF